MKINNKKMIIMAIFFVLLMCISSKVNATSISIMPNNPKVGDTVTVTVSISNVNTASLTANVSGVASGTIKVVGGDLTGQPSTFSKSESFYCSSEGTLSVSVSSDSSAVLNGEYVNVGASASVKVAASSQNENNNTNNQNLQNNNTSNNNGGGENTAGTTTTTKSNNANLKNLGIKPNDFKGFKPWTTSYDVTVPNNVEQVSVYATKQDTKASITGTGIQKLNIGKNTLNVVVTAEDGTKKTYSINVTRQEAENSSNNDNNNTTQESTTDEEEPKEKQEENKEEEISNSDLQKLEITGYTLTPTFSPDIYEYTLTVNQDVSNLDILTEGANHNVKIEIVGNSNFVEGENTVTILVYNEETEQNSTYQIVVNKTNLDLEDLNSNLNEAVKKANRIRFIVLGIVIFIIVCVIIFILVRHNYKNKNEYDAYEYDEEDKERLNLDDEEDFFHRVNKELIEETNENTDNQKITEISNSISNEESKEENKNNLELPTEEVAEEKQEEEEEFFRTAKTKRKGKHF